mmetsp:Transcript_56484/g.123781  ORF Transcript_56484/g.123781 Transcript_56484/m.123781 type:complete len:256 (+) Transcript_56484:1061-1828(+)
MPRCATGQASRPRRWQSTILRSTLQPLSQIPFECHQHPSDPMQKEHVFIIVVKQQALDKLVDAQLTRHVVVHDFKQSLGICHATHFVEKILKIGLHAGFLKLLHGYIFVPVCVCLFEQLFKLFGLSFPLLPFLLLLHLPVLFRALEALLNNNSSDQIHQRNPCQQREAIEIYHKPPLLQDDWTSNAGPRVESCNLHKGDHCSPNSLKVGCHQVLNDGVGAQRLVIVDELFASHRKHEKYQAHQNKSPDESHNGGK